MTLPGEHIGPGPESPLLSGLYPATVHHSTAIRSTCNESRSH